MATVPTSRGEVVLLDRGSGEVEGIVLGVTSLHTVRALHGARLQEADDRVAWLDPSETFGLALGFVEV